MTAERDPLDALVAEIEAMSPQPTRIKAAPVTKASRSPKREKRSEPPVVTETDRAAAGGDDEAMPHRTTDEVHQHQTPFTDEVLKRLCEKLVSGIPIELACDALDLDSNELDRLRKLGQRGRGGKFTDRVYRHVKTAMAQCYEQKIQKLLQGDHNAVAAVKAYIDIFRPEWAQKERLRLQYELMTVMKVVSETEGVTPDLMNRIAERLSDIDDKAMMLSLDEFLLPGNAG